MKLWPLPDDPPSTGKGMRFEAWLVGLSLIVILLWSLASCSSSRAKEDEQTPLQDCYVVDGDTLRCGAERIRLLGIDAPETGGRCRPWRQCVPGDPLRSKLALERAVASMRLTIDGAGQDRYGRTLGVVYANGRNVSCELVRGGYAEYVERWDNGGRVRRDCPAVSR